MIRITDIFTTPFVEAKIANQEAICEELRVLLLEREAEGDKYRNEIRRVTQFGPLFESKFDLFRWDDAPVQKVARFCHASIGQVLAHTSDYTAEELQKLTFSYNAWFHVTRNGGFQGLHNHQNASWSGIFCVDPGDSPPDRPDSGLVRFHDPRGCSWFYSEAGNIRLKMPFQHGAFDVSHRAGRLLIFPSYLNHEIFPYQGARPRIVIAFNCSITKR